MRPVPFRTDGCPSCEARTNTVIRWRSPTATALQLLQLAVFDLIVNNADRKGGHIYERVRRDGARGRPRPVFPSGTQTANSAVGFAGRPVPAALLTDLDRIRPQVPDCLTGLDGDEVAGTAHRIQEILDRPVMPAPMPVPRPSLAAAVAVGPLQFRDAIVARSGGPSRRGSGSSAAPVRHGNR